MRQVYKPREFARQAMRLFSEHRRCALWAYPGTGKCHGFDTPILMADGSIRMVQDVREGDQLMGPNGGPRHVWGVTSGRGPLYRVTPVKGDPYVVNEDHVLSLSYYGKIVNVSVREYLQRAPTFRERAKGWRAPTIERFHRPQRPLEVPPYVAGCYLGDGTTGRHQDRLTQTLRTDRGQPNPVLDALRATGLIHKEGIPSAYLYAPAADRRELLAGMVDTDGHTTNGGVGWISKSEQMAKDFAFLCRSLGLACYIRKCRKGIRTTGFVGTYWRAFVSGDLSTIPMRDKPCPPRRQIKNVRHTGITVESIGEGDYYGFCVSDDHLYLLGDFTVTHNTSLVLTFLEQLYTLGGESRPTLVVAPRRVAQNVWSEEVAKWEHLRGLDVVRLMGTPAERRRALAVDAPIYVINYEGLQWLEQELQKQRRSWPFGIGVADESTRIKNYRLTRGGMRARILARHAHIDMNRWINLTGTPAANGLQDLWGQTWYLDEGERLGRTYGAFQERWFRPVITKRGVKWLPTQYAEAEIYERLDDICLTLDPRDWYDLSEVYSVTVKVKLSKKVMAQYRALEQESYLRLGEEKTITAFSANALTMKCRQLAGGAVYHDDDSSRWHEVHGEKLDALDEIIADTGEDKLLVVYHFRSDLARLKKRYRDALDLGTDAGLAAAKAGKGGRIWLAQPGSLAHGVDGLQRHCHTVVFFAQDWSHENRTQVIDRVGPMRQFQIGSKELVRVFYLVAEGTLDEVIAQRRDGKASVEAALMDYMKRKYE